jgi:biopolymer transport protein ExbD
MNFSTGKKRRHFALDITPLIDVTFTLLLFIMITTTFDKPNLLNVDLPAAQNSQAQDLKDKIIIVITLDGRFYDKELKTFYSKDELSRQLELLHNKNPNALVAIEADRRVSHGLVVSLMDLAKSQGLNRIGIATKAKE